MLMTAENMDRARTRTIRASKKLKVFCFESFRDKKKIFVKNSSHPRLSATTKRRKGALMLEVRQKNDRLQLFHNNQP